MRKQPNHLNGCSCAHHSTQDQTTTMPAFYGKPGGYLAQSHTSHDMSRRSVLSVSTLAVAAAFLPRSSFANTSSDAAAELSWDRLIPEGIPYPEVTGVGKIDAKKDIWLPVFDDNASRVVDALEGAQVQLPGYVVPLEAGVEGVSTFLLSPQVGLCSHVQPPPPNQLVFVHTEVPWLSQKPWEAVTVSGELRIQTHETDIAVSAYALEAKAIDYFDWG